MITTVAKPRVLVAAPYTVADLENEKGWFQFIVALARRKIFVGHAHFGHVRTLICHMIVQVNFH